MPLHHNVLRRLPKAGQHVDTLCGIQTSLPADKDSWFDDVDDEEMCALCLEMYKESALAHVRAHTARSKLKRFFVYIWLSIVPKRYLITIPEPLLPAKNHRPLVA